jgi:hypothetical protein
MGQRLSFSNEDLMHIEQNTWPQDVNLGSVIKSRQIEHFDLSICVLSPFFTEVFSYSPQARPLALLFPLVMSVKILYVTFQDNRESLQENEFHYLSAKQIELIFLEVVDDAAAIQFLSL